MIYPGTSPMVGGNDPNSLEQRKQQLMKQLAGGQGLANNLSFGGVAGDAPARGPSLSFNPFLNAVQHILGNTNAGQVNNSAVTGHPFFGGQQNIPGNAAQAAAVTTGVASGSAGMGGVAGTPAAAPSGVNSGTGFQAPSVAPGGVTGIPTNQVAPFGLMQLFGNGTSKPLQPTQPILALPGMGKTVFGF